LVNDGRIGVDIGKYSFIDYHRFVDLKLIKGNGVAESLVGLQWRKDDSPQLDRTFAELAWVSLAWKRCCIEKKRQRSQDINRKVKYARRRSPVNRTEMSTWSDAIQRIKRFTKTRGIGEERSQRDEEIDQGK